MSLAGFAVFFGVFALCLCLEIAAIKLACRVIVTDTLSLITIPLLALRSDLLDPLLRPFEILLHFLRSFHAVCEIRAIALQPALSQSLQFHKLTILGVELAGPMVSSICGVLQDSSQLFAQSLYSFRVDKIRY